MIKVRSYDDGQPLIQFAFGRMTDVFYHECSSTFCHRLTFTYGHLYHYHRMNKATHDAMSSARVVIFSTTWWWLDPASVDVRDGPAPA